MYSGYRMQNQQGKDTERGVTCGNINTRVLFGGF